MFYGRFSRSSFQDLTLDAADLVATSMERQLEDDRRKSDYGSALRGYPAASELLEAAAHVDLVVVRTALEELEQEDGATRVTVPIRELIHNEELFRTAVFRVREGAITSYETLGND